MIVLYTYLFDFSSPLPSWLPFESRVLIGWTLSHSFPSPVPTVLLPFFSPNSYLSPDQSLLSKPWLLPRSEARGGQTYSLGVVLEPPHSVYSLFDVFRSAIGGIASGLSLLPLGIASPLLVGTCAFRVNL